MTDFNDLLRQVRTDRSAALQLTQGRVPYRNAPRPLPPSMRGPTVIPRAEIDRDTAQRQAFAPPRDQIREAASMAGELVGTEPLARGVMALRGDYTGRPEPGRAAGEFGMAAVNLGLGALGLADDVATVRAARPLPPGQWENVYRGLMQPFDGEFRSFPEGWYGDTLSVARNPEHASFYARRDTGPTFGEGANVMPLQVRGPFATLEQQREAAQPYMPNLRGRPWTREIGERQRRALERANADLRAKGYTGVETEIDSEIALFRESIPNNIRSRFDAPPPATESAPRPTPPPRQIGRASDGSVLPVREPQPIRQSLVGGSDDLREAAGMRLARDPLPPLRTMGQREDWAQGALRPQRGYEFRGPRDSRYGVRFERTANGTEVTLESLTPGTSQYGRRDENIMSMGEARSVYQRALAAIEHDIATTARDRYVVGGLKPQHRRIFRAMAERQMRANGWPGYVLEDGPSNTLVLRRVDDVGPAGSNNRPDPHGEGVGADMRRPLFPGQRGIRAYHGSPHDFDRFDLSRIGTGEGAQAYGHGLYFAENEGVARAYRDKLGINSVNGLTADGGPVQAAALNFEQARGNRQRALRSLESDLEYIARRARPEDAATIENWRQAADLLRDPNYSPPGRMYEVNINAAPEEFLDWDAPLGAQPERARQALSGLNVEDGPNGVYWLRSAANRVAEQDGSWNRAANLSNLTPRLRAAGIPGIRYLDQGSRRDPNWRVTFPQSQNPEHYWEFADEASARAFMRGKEGASLQTPAEAQTRNYVVFDDSLIEILRKYGLAGLAYGGAGGAAIGAQQNAPGS